MVMLWSALSLVAVYDVLLYHGKGFYANLIVGCNLLHYFFMTSLWCSNPAPKIDSLNDIQSRRVSVKSHILTALYDESLFKMSARVDSSIFGRFSTSLTVKFCNIPPFYTNAIIIQRAYQTYILQSICWIICERYWENRERSRFMFRKTILKLVFKSEQEIETTSINH